MKSLFNKTRQMRSIDESGIDEAYDESADTITIDGVKYVAIDEAAKRPKRPKSVGGTKSKDL